MNKLINKSILFFFAVLLCSSLIGQDIELIQDADNYRLQTYTLTDSDEGGVDTLFSSSDLGDKDQALAAILRLWRQNRRTQYLSMASKWEANYTRQNATFEQLAAQLDFDIDSVYTSRNWQTLFADTVALRVPTSIIPTESLFEFTTDTINLPEVIDLTLVPELRGNGSVRLNSIDTPGSWRVVINGRQGLELRNFAGRTREFFLHRQSERRKVYISEDGLSNRSDASRIVIIYDDNQIEFE
jgi:hypothetical protein